MEELREVSTSHVRRRRDAEPDAEKNKCNQTGVLVIGNDTMLYVNNIFLVGNQNNSDSFNNKTSKPTLEATVTNQTNYTT